MKDRKPWSFCETPEEKCTMNYCDENGCQNRKRNYVQGNDLIADVVQRYSLIQIQSTLTGEILDTWYRPDMMLFVERYVLEKGKVVDKFRILPNTNDVRKIGHIDFTKHYYNNFEDAVKAMVSLDVA